MARESGGKVFLLLDPADQSAQRTVVDVRSILQRELERFNQISNPPALEVDGSWQTFVSKLLADPSQRTIISALYVFVLEFHEHVRELELREGSTGGSNQPFTVHLFTGGLLFESLLKLCYPTNDDGDNNRTLRGVLSTGQFLRDFSLSPSKSRRVKGNPVTGYPATRRLADGRTRALWRLGSGNPVTELHTLLRHKVQNDPLPIP